MTRFCALCNFCCYKRIMVHDQKMLYFQNLGTEARKGGARPAKGPCLRRVAPRAREGCTRGRN